NGAITVEPGVHLNLGPQGEVAFHAARIDIGGFVVAPGGGVLLEGGSTVRPPAGGLILASGARSFGARQWGHGLPPFFNAERAQAIDGGSVTVTSTTGVVLAAGSSIDVSSGALYSSAGTLQSGAPGSVAITTNRGVSFGSPATGALVFDGTITG